MLRDCGLMPGVTIGELVTLARRGYPDPLTTEHALELAGLAGAGLHAVRWAAFGLVYGYFYPLLRGRSAFPKAAGFAAAMLPVELVVAWLGDGGSSDLSALGTAAIQLCAFSAVLALAWEVRQARRAGVGWDAIRDLRSLRTLAAPAGAVLLAAVTAAATTFANTEIPNWVAPQHTAVAPQGAATSGAGGVTGAGDTAGP